MKRLLSITLMILFAAVPVMAESVFGPLGVGLWQQNGNARSVGLAGSDMAFSDSIYFAIDNPATWRSYGVTKYTVSFAANKVYASDYTGEDIADNYVFPNAALLLPFYKSFGLGFYYQALTDHDYLIHRSDTYDIEQPVDTLETYDLLRRVQGNGGMSRAGAVLAFQVLQKVDVGIGLDYYFGQLEELVTIDFQQGSFSRSGRYILHEINGVGVNLGFTAHPSQNSAVSLTVRPPAMLDVASSLTIQAGDSVGFADEQFEMPLSLGLGGYIDYGRLRTLARINYTAWKESEHSIASEFEYDNSVDVGLGFERIPLREPLVPWYEEATFRAGLRYQQHYVRAGGNPLYTYGAAVGMGMPIAYGRGVFEFALTYDMRGTVTDNLAKERIYGIQIGISSTERWFVRRQR
ncbi:hypothetical protein KQI52_02225 [bacterium]|nr:hypothetical protein [bacterium]